MIYTHIDFSSSLLFIILQIKQLNFHFDFAFESSANQRVKLSFRFFFESHFNDLFRFDDDLLRIKKSSVIRDKDRSRESVSKQKQMFERFNHRKRSDFEQMKNINFIEAFEQMSSSRRRDRSSERKRREKRENDRDVKRDTRDDARNDARDDARNDARDDARGDARDDARGDARNDARDDARDDVVGGDVEDDVTDETNVFMKNVF